MDSGSEGSGGTKVNDALSLPVNRRSLMISNSPPPLDRERVVSQYISSGHSRSGNGASAALIAGLRDEDPERATIVVSMHGATDWNRIDPFASPSAIGLNESS